MEKKSKKRTETKLLYTCNTTWYGDIDPDNTGDVKFYCSAEAVTDNTDCASSCGVVEVEAKIVRTVIEGKDFSIPILELPERQRAQAEHEKKVQEQETAILHVLNKEVDLETQAEALAWALYKINTKLRAKRQEKRESK